MIFKGGSNASSFMRDEVIVGILGNNQIKDKTAEGYLQSITEFLVQEYNSDQLTTMYGETEHELMTKAFESGRKYLIAIKVGTITKNFCNTMERYFSEVYQGELFVGHVLDKGDEYYCMHPQYWLIDLEWWDSIGRPEFADRKRNEKWEAIKPLRSAENFHDGYTPHWVKAGTELVEYTGKEYGWNIIQAALRDGTVGIWNEKVRRSKFYMYAEVQQDYHRNIPELQLFTSMNKFFASNTEHMEIRRLKLYQYDAVVCPAGGPMPMLLAFSKNIKKHGNLLILDISPVALEMQRRMCNDWDGKNYAKFIRDIARKEPWLGDLFVAEDGVDAQSEFIDNLEGFQEWFQEVWPTLTIRIEERNVYDIDNFKRRIGKFVGNNNTKTYIHLSNIFNYMPTSVFYNYESKKQMVVSLEEYFEKINNQDNGAKITSTLWFRHGMEELLGELPWYKPFKKRD